MALPRVCGDLETVEFFDHFVNAIDAGQARRWRHVLPGEEEAHEIGGGDRLDFGAQAVERVAGGAREGPAGGPFWFGRGVGGKGAEGGGFGVGFLEGGGG